MMRTFLATGLYSLLLLHAPAAAQDFGNEWLAFIKDNSRLVAPAELGLDDPEEKDYAVGDLDRDGWTDLVVVRKQPFTTSGRRVNVLLMNEQGTLTDRTAQYATASDVPGDDGFMTPTNDRDVVIVDIDGDGWLDVVTATTLSAGLPKHISHPRVYRNLGRDAAGNWRGLRYEDFRFPQLLLADGTPSWPRFSAVAAGDVTGDGMVDLYFCDHDTGGTGGGDMNDRLLVNDGTGVFVDESRFRMTHEMLNSSFGIAAAVVDLDLDGALDIVKNTALASVPYVSASYNDPGNVGFFDYFDAFHLFAPYFVSTGDLNNDGRPDVVVSDDGPDLYRYNLGPDLMGGVIWGPPMTFHFLWGGDDGFGSNSYVVDLDQDSWADVIICDVDIDISGCGRRAHIYHNRGGVPGQQIRLVEEAELAGPGGWKGVGGITADDLRGIHDVAILDIDGDGDLDLVLGSCTGTDLWFNQLDPVRAWTSYCACDGSGAAPPCANPGADGCLNSSAKSARLAAFGSGSVTADDLVFVASGLLPGETALLFAGDTALAGGRGVAFGDGLRCAGGALLRLGVQLPNVVGDAYWYGSARGAGWTAGDVRHFQAWYRDPAGGPCASGFNLTQALRVEFVP